MVKKALDRAIWLCAKQPPANADGCRFFSVPPDQQQQVRIQLAAVLECVVSQQLLKRSDGQGRVAALEVLFANNAVRNLIREGKTFQIASIIQTSKRLGMQMMDDALYDLYMQRMVDGETVISYAQDPVTMNKKINFI